MIDICELHERLTKHLFPAYSSEDEHFLTLALYGESGELANLIKKRWRDGVPLTEEVKDELADLRVYSELLAKCYGAEGAKLQEYMRPGRLALAGLDERQSCVKLGRFVGELCTVVLQRWDRPDIYLWAAVNALADFRVCLDHICELFDLTGDKLEARIVDKLARVVEKHKARLEANAA